MCRVDSRKPFPIARLLKVGILLEVLLALSIESRGKRESMLVKSKSVTLDQCLPQTILHLGTFLPAALTGKARVTQLSHQEIVADKDGNTGPQGANE